MRLIAEILDFLIASMFAIDSSVRASCSMYCFIALLYSLSNATWPNASIFCFNQKNLLRNCSLVVVSSRNILETFLIVFSSRPIHFWRLYFAICFGVYLLELVAMLLPYELNNLHNNNDLPTKSNMKSFFT